MIRKEDIVTVGKFQKTHALKGELNMLSEIGEDYYKEGNPLIVKMDGIFVPFFAESVRRKGSLGYLIKLSGIDSEKDAAPFVNQEFGILKKDADEWLEEDLIDQELLDYTVIEEVTGKPVGKIKEIEDSTENIVFIVEEEDGSEIFLPANEDLISEIDDNQKIIIMKIPDGLIDLNK